MGLLDSFLKGVSKGAELDGGPEQRLANAYSLMNQNLQRDEEDQETQYYNNLMAAAGDGKERSIEDYRKILDERQKSGAKPTTGRTETPSWMKAYEGPTPIQRWKKQIDAMIQSGNPDLQEQGLDLIASYQQRATQAPSKVTDIRTQGEKYADALGLKGKQRLQYIDKFAMKQNYADPANTPYTVNELAKLQIPDGKGGWKSPPPGFTPRQATEQGAKLKGGTTAGDAGKVAMLQTALSNVPKIKSTLYKEDGSINRDVLNLAYAFSKDPTTNAFASKSLAKFSGRFSPEQIEQAKELSNSLEYGMQAITRTETGAAMPVEDIDNTRTRFQPAIDDGPELIKQKMDAYIYFLENSLDMIDPTIRKGNDGAALSKEVEKAVDKAFEMTKKRSKIDIDPNKPLEDQGMKRIPL